MEKLTIKELKTIADTVTEDQYPQLIKMFSADERTAVRKMALALSKKLDQKRIEKDRLIQLFRIEESFCRQNVLYVGGVDEAGRGPLAGPVVAACVVLRENPFIEGINDSKKLSHDKREAMFDLIQNKVESYGIGMADHEEIDKLNILEATMLAMRRAVEACKIKPQFVLVDGNQMIRRLKYPQKTIIKGDSKCVSIACASILAKVTRDRMMIEYADIYKDYGFEKHKGYGTAEHVQSIRMYGPSAIHRISFLKNIIM